MPLRASLHAAVGLAAVNSTVTNLCDNDAPHMWFFCKISFTRRECEQALGLARHVNCHLETVSVVQTILHRMQGVWKETALFRHLLELDVRQHRADNLPGRKPRTFPNWHLEECNRAANFRIHKRQAVNCVAQSTAVDKRAIPVRLVQALEHFLPNALHRYKLEQLIKRSRNT